MNVPQHPDVAHRVPGGHLLLNPNRCSPYPYLYKVDAHPLVDDHAGIQTILVFIVDTSREARHALYTWESTLRVPLGPDSGMEALGMVLRQLFIAI